EISPQTGVLWSNLMDALGRQGHFGAGDSAYRRFRELAPTAQNRFQLGYRLSWAKGDYAAAAGYADSAAQIDQPFYQAMSRGQRAALNRFRGQMKESRRLALEATEINLRRGIATAPFFTATQVASGVVLLEGRADEAVRILDSVVARYPLDSLEPASRPYMQLAI